MRNRGERMTVHGKINGQPTREALKDLRCALCGAPINLVSRNMVWDHEVEEDEWFIAHESA